MGWIRSLFGRIRTNGPYSADQIIKSLVGARVVPVDRTSQELLAEGWDARRRNQPEIAHEHFVAAAQSASECNDSRVFGRALVALADNALHFYPDAVDVFRIRAALAARAKEILNSIHDDSGVAQALRVQSSMAHGAAGREMLEESLRISKRIGDAEGVLSSIDYLGSHLAVYGAKAEANDFKRQALDMARVLGNQERIADCLFSLSIGFEGSQSEHRAILEEAQMLYGKLGRKAPQSRCLMLCAQLACDDSDFERRKDYLERASQLACEAGDLLLGGTCLDILISLFRDQGDMSKAEMLEQVRNFLPKDEFPVEMVKELEQAFSDDVQTGISALRKWFSGRTS